MIPLGVLASARVSAGGGALTSTFLQSAALGTDTATYTFASQNLGTAAADRRIIVGFGCRAGTSTVVTSVTVGGISATILSQESTNNVSVLAMAHVPTGTTGNVVVTLTAGAARAAVGLWRVVGGTPTLAAQDAGSGANATAGPLTIPPGGVGFGCLAQQPVSVVTFTGLANDGTEIVESNLRVVLASSSTPGSTTAATDSSAGALLTYAVLESA